jgi:hypothetical protein
MGAIAFLEERRQAVRSIRPPSPPMDVGAYVHAILDVANSLMRNGYVIHACFFQGRPSRMVIELYDAPALRDLVRVGQAAYYEHGCDDDGPYRRGAFERGGVNVIWVERGGA